MSTQIERDKTTNRDELEEDGYRVVIRSEFERFYGDPANLIAPQARQIALFPRRAVLRVGMLLRDSDVAKRVRDVRPVKAVPA